jgi:hypothetical protein
MHRSYIPVDEPNPIHISFNDVLKLTGLKPRDISTMIRRFQFPPPFVEYGAARFWTDEVLRAVERNKRAA